MDTTSKDQTLPTIPAMRRERKKTVSFCDDVSEASTEVSHLDFCDEDISEDISDARSNRRTRQESECSLSDSECSAKERPRGVSFLLPVKECQQEEDATIINVGDLCLPEGLRGQENQLTCVVPVHKAMAEGGIEVSLKPSVITKKDGSRVVITEEGAKHLPPAKRVKQLEITLMKVFSAITLFFFPPLGLVVLFLATKTCKAYKQGLQDGDMDKTYVWKNRTENLIIVSIFCGILLWGGLAVLIQNLKTGGVDEVVAA